MSTIIDFSIFPVDKGDSLSPYVARAMDIIKASGLKYHMGPMGTSIEGEWGELQALINRCFEDLKTDCNRVIMTIKVDHRKGASDRIRSKIRSVEEKLTR